VAFPNCIVADEVPPACRPYHKSGKNQSRVSVVFAPDDGDKRGRPGWRVTSGVDAEPNFDAEPNENVSVYDVCLLTEASYEYMFLSLKESIS
jgi:hypothetical protein